MTLNEYLEQLPTRVEEKHAADVSVVQLGTMALDAIEALDARASLALSRELLSITAAPSALAQGATGRLLVVRAIRGACAECLRRGHLTEQQIVNLLTQVWT